MMNVTLRTLSRFAGPLLALPRPLKRVVVLALDACLCVLSVLLAFYLRLGDFVPLTGAALWPVLASMVLALPIFITAGFYRAIFRYSGLSAMMVKSPWAAAGFKDTLLRCQMKREVANGDEKEIQPGVQA